MAALPPPPPLNLPDDVLRKILARIPCKVDRYRIALVCPAWRRVIDRLRLTPPRPLPWLMLPSRYSDGSTRVACVLSGCRVHDYLTVTPPGWRCFGSHDGAWLFLYFHQPRRHHVLLNVRTGEARLLMLPAMVRTLNGFGPFDMVVHAAALSAPPDDPRCIAAGIFTACVYPDDPPPGPGPGAQPRGYGVALWGHRSRRGLAREIWADEPRQEHMSAEDVVYHNGAFHFVTTANHIRLCSPTLDQNGLPYLRLGAGWVVRRFEPIVGIYDIRARYLVKSREELLLVLRFMPRPSAQPWTPAFKVFQATQLLQNTNDLRSPEYRWSWSELHALGGRMLFVGRGCSRSYETDQYPGFHDGIYFLDDDALYHRSATFRLGNGNVMRYPCSDNGKWSEGRVQSCFPSSKPSDSSPPAWLLP
ncbi:hypothetical protein BS78_02G166400 [Paspalum vaginatum]|nr:hypothetical protein BS78_02G166400 [Paspalum vaginatum]